MKTEVVWNKCDFPARRNIPEHRDMEEILNKIRPGFVYLGSGRGRATFRCPSGKYVIKIPVNASGIRANLSEVNLWKHRRPTHPYARCRLLKNDYLMMEYVEPIIDSETPTWAHAWDTGQVGRNSKGMILVYDYAD